MSYRYLFLVLLCTTCMQLSCRKDKPSKPVVVPPVISPLFTDSVLYIDATNKNIVYPAKAAPGTYACFPDGLKIDDNTGAIDVNNSETGLKYRITFTPAGAGDTRIAYITISGINYKDGIYNLAAGDSIAAPIYNANKHAMIPQINNGSSFDENSGCKSAGIEVDPVDATINLAKSVRDQKIDTGSTQEVKLQYRINDQSNKALNGLDVKIYFYRTASEIPQYLIDILNERKTTILSANSNGLSAPAATPKAFSSFAVAYSAQKPTRPRPPCVIVVSR